MSAETTEAVFAALALANVPAHSWTAQSFTNHAHDPGPVAVTGYNHTIDAGGVVTLTFTVDHAGTTAALAGRFKKGTVNALDRNGAPQAPPTFGVPIDAGTGGITPTSIQAQIWYRYEEGGGTLREFRFATSVNFPPTELIP